MKPWRMVLNAAIGAGAALFLAVLLVVLAPEMTYPELCVGSGLLAIFSILMFGLMRGVALEASREGYMRTLADVEELFRAQPIDGNLRDVCEELSIMGARIEYAETDLDAKLGIGRIIRAAADYANRQGFTLEEALRATFPGEFAGDGPEAPEESQGCTCIGKLPDEMHLEGCPKRYGSSKRPSPSKPSGTFD